MKSMYEFREASKLTILCVKFCLHEQCVSYNFHCILKADHEPKMLITIDLHQIGNCNLKD